MQNSQNGMASARLTPNFPGIPGCGMYGLGAPGMMPFHDNDGDLKNLSVIYQAVRIADREFLQLVLDKGANLNRRESDGSTPMHHAAANPDSSILKYFLDKQPKQTKEDFHTAIHTAASHGLLDHVKLLERAGANLDDIIGASLHSQNLNLIEYLIQKAKNRYSKTKLGGLPLLSWRVSSGRKRRTANLRRMSLRMKLRSGA